MKLLLSDGTRLKLGSYDRASVKLNGTVTDGIVLEVKDTTAEAVRTLFNSPSNLEEISIYSDTDVFKDKFSGYQVRHSIALGEEPGSFVVVIAKGTDVEMKLAVLSKDVQVLSTSVADALKAFSEISQNVSDMLTQIQNSAKVVTDIKTTVNDHGAAINALSTREEERDNRLETLLQRITKVNTAISESNQLSLSMRNDFQNASQQVSDAMSSVNKMLQDSDNMAADYKAKAENFDLVERHVGDARQAAMDAETAASSASDKVATMEKDLGAFTEKVEKTVTEHTKTLENAAQDVEAVKKIVNDAADTVVAFEGRLTALEPITDLTTLSLEDAKAAKIKESEELLAQWLNDHPIESIAHKGVAAYYSITREKQGYLRDMIITASEAAASGIDFQPSWNAVGEPCTKDWTIDELRQLALEISVVVRPLVTHQQYIDRTIQECTTVDAVVAVVIDYSGIGPETIAFVTPEETPEADTVTE